VQTAPHRRHFPWTTITLILGVVVAVLSGPIAGWLTAGLASRSPLTVQDSQAATFKEGFPDPTAPPVWPPAMLPEPASSGPMAAAPGATAAAKPARDAEGLFARASGSVVRIIVKDQEGQEIALGSGFFVSADGLVVTNHHVVNGAFDAVVILSNERRLKVEGLAALDREKDLALLKVKTQGQKPLALAGGEPPRVGATVYAIGNPRGLTNTLSQGLVSAVRGDGGRPEMIQTTAAVSPGSSGGPLLDTRGMVVGVNTLVYRDSQNLNFAVAVWAVADLVAKRQKPRPLAQAIGLPYQALLQAKLRTIDKLIDEGRLTEAHDGLVTLGEDYGSDRRYLRRLAFVLLRSHRETEAITILRDLLAEQPNDAESLSMLGCAYGSSRDLKSAQETLERALALKPDDARVRGLLLGAYLAEIGPSSSEADRDRIESKLRDLAGRFPNDPEVHMALGLICRGRPGKKADAVQAFQRVVELAPDGPQRRIAESELSMLRSVPGAPPPVLMRQVPQPTSASPPVPSPLAAGVELRGARLRVEGDTPRWLVVTLVNRTRQPLVLKSVATDPQHALIIGTVVKPGLMWTGRVQVEQVPAELTVQTSAGMSTFGLQF
jgi:S1-C subfamily serine protease